MVCGKFVIKDTVQDVGVRAKIVANAPKGLNVEAWNMRDGTVAVYVGASKEEEIVSFRDIVKNIAESGELGKGSVEVSELEFDELCEVDKLTYSDRLIAEQMSKFIEVGQKGFGDLSMKIDRGFNDISKKLDGGFNNLSKKLDGGFNNLSKKLDELPERIAKAMKEAK